MCKIRAFLTYIHLTQMIFTILHIIDIYIYIFKKPEMIKYLFSIYHTKSWIIFSILFPWLQKQQQQIVVYN